MFKIFSADVGSSTTKTAIFEGTHADAVRLAQELANTDDVAKVLNSSPFLKLNSSPSLLLNTDDLEGTEGIEYKRVKYFVGEEASVEGDLKQSEVLGSPDFHGSETTKILIAKAIANSRINRTTHFDALLYALPYDQSNHVEPRRTQNIKQEFKNIDFRYYNRTIGPKTFNISFHQIETTAQGFGAAKLFQIAECESNNNVLVVDIGGYTTDIVHLKRKSNGAFALVKNKSLSLRDFSVNEFTKKIFAEIKRKDPSQTRTFDYYNLVRKLENRNYTFRTESGSIESFESFFISEVEKFSKNLYQKISDLVAISEIDKIQLTGGGANLITLDKDFWKASSRTVKLSPYSNCIGQIFGLLNIGNDELSSPKQAVLKTPNHAVERTF